MSKSQVKRMHVAFQSGALSAAANRQNRLRFISMAEEPERMAVALDLPGNGRRPESKWSFGKIISPTIKRNTKLFC